MKAIVCLMCVATAAALPMMGVFEMSNENGVVVADSMELLSPATAALANSMTRAEKVAELQRMLNSGMMDRSDEMLARTLVNNPQSLGNPDFFIDASREIKFLTPNVGVGGGQAVASGGPAPLVGQGLAASGSAPLGDQRFAGSGPTPLGDQGLVGSGPAPLGDQGLAASGPAPFENQGFPPGGSASPSGQDFVASGFSSGGQDFGSAGQGLATDGAAPTGGDNFGTENQPKRK